MSRTPSDVNQKDNSSMGRLSSPDPPSAPFEAAQTAPPGADSPAAKGKPETALVPTGDEFLNAELTSESLRPTPPSPKVSGKIRG